MILSRTRQPNSGDYWINVPGMWYTDGPLCAIPDEDPAGSEYPVYEIWHNDAPLYFLEKFRSKVARRIIKDLYLLPLSWNNFTMNDIYRLDKEDQRVFYEVLEKVREAAIAAFTYKPVKPKQPKKPLTDRQRFLEQRRSAAEEKGDFYIDKTAQGEYCLLWSDGYSFQDIGIRVMDPGVNGEPPKDLKAIHSALVRNAAYMNFKSSKPPLELYPH